MKLSNQKLAPQHHAAQMPLTFVSVRVRVFTCGVVVEQKCFVVFLWQYLFAKKLSLSGSMK